MGIAAEFARFNAKLANVQWAVSARTAEGVVMSLWQHKLRTENGVWVYRDRLSRWQGPGNRLFAEHLREALEHNLQLRMVKAWGRSSVSMATPSSSGSRSRISILMGIADEPSIDIVHLLRACAAGDESGRGR